MDEILNYPHFKICETERDDDEFNYRSYTVYVVRWRDLNTQVRRSGVHHTHVSAMNWIKKNHQQALGDRFEKEVLCGRLE